MSWLFNALTLGADAVLFIVLGNLALNLRAVRRPDLRAVSDLREPFPLVSVLVPARNEELRLAPCLESLLAQDYPNLELIVLDDQSEDRTAETAAAFGFSTRPEARRRLLGGSPLQPGWTGKAWACQQLAEAAHGRFLLFTDADTVHHPRCVSAAVTHSERTRADLLTLWPFQVTRTWSEILVIPLIFVAAGGVLPHWLLAAAQRHPKLAKLLGPAGLRGLGAANGQFLLFRREAYFALGGHRAVADHLVEDVALGREVAGRTGSGYRLVSGNGTELVRCRMYGSLPELWEGFTKNLHPLFEGNEFLFLSAVAVQAWLFLWPFLVCWWWRSPALAVQFLLIFGVRAVAASLYRTSFRSVLLHPFGYGLALLIATNSWRCASGKGVTWKGRLYQVTAENRRKRAGA